MMSSCQAWDRNMVVGKECARCLLNNEKHDLHEKAKSSYYSCNGCKKKKSLLDFSPTTIKNFLQRRKKNFWYGSLRCWDCQYPTCARPECGQRPLHAVVGHTGWIKGKYFCRNCRYPPCSGCGKERQTISGKVLFKKWQCATCLANRVQCPGCSRFIS